MAQMWILFLLNASFFVGLALYGLAPVHIGTLGWHAETNLQIVMNNVFAQGGYGDGSMGYDSSMHPVSVSENPTYFSSLFLSRTIFHKQYA